MWLDSDFGEKKWVVLTPTKAKFRCSLGSFSQIQLQRDGHHTNAWEFACVHRRLTATSMSETLLTRHLQAQWARRWGKCYWSQLRAQEVTPRGHVDSMYCIQNQHCADRYGASQEKKNAQPDTLFAPKYISHENGCGISPWHPQNPLVENGTACQTSPRGCGRFPASTRCHCRRELNTVAEGIHICSST